MQYNISSSWWEISNLTRYVKNTDGGSNKLVYTSVDCNFSKTEETPICGLTDQIEGLFRMSVISKRAIKSAGFKEAFL